MSYNENTYIVNDAIIETKPIKQKQYKPIDPNINKLYYHEQVAPIECDVCGCIGVTRALDNPKQNR